jgi:methanethiol S-methyltransferase
VEIDSRTPSGTRKSFDSAEHKFCGENATKDARLRKEFSMKRILVLLFGVLCYVIFLNTFLYQIGFVANLWVPKAIDVGDVVPPLQSVGIDVVLLGLFAIQHTIMARLAFKRWWKTIIPPPIERSIFVLLSSLLLLLMNWQWKPLPEFVWHVENMIGRIVLFGVSTFGWGLVLYATFLINHFDLFGLRQVWLYFRGQEYAPVHFKETVLYRWVRHPLMLGFIIAFWATPDMTQGHLLFASVTTVYVIVAIQIEELTLVAMHGEDYRRYQRRVSMIIPMHPKPIE